MAYLSANRRAEPPLLRFEPFKGINQSVTPTQIHPSQAEDMLNMKISLDGALEKRTGYERVFATSLGDGPINGLYEFKKSDGTVIFLVAHGTKLYTQEGNNQPVEIYNGLANDRVTFFTMNDTCYLLDGFHYLEYDGESVKEIVPYVPTISISKEPAGGGEPYEDFNLLGSGFQDSFSTLGEDTVFQLSLSGLDATKVKAEIHGVEKVEGTDFTVDRTTGKVTFNTAPPKGTNNVLITAYKTFADFPNRIKKCRFYTIFGGSNDSRVFLAGNKDMPDYVWRSGLFDPTYFPENGFYKFPDKVMGFVKQYDYLVIERERGKHLVTYQLNSDGFASFPSKPIQDTVGCIAPNSIQLIENNPVSLSRNGVYTLVASTIRDERNIQHISANIDKLLLKEPNLENIISIDYDQKYWLAINGNVYIYDYAINEWYRYDNVKANCLYEKNRGLYFGSSEEGLLYRFKQADELFPYNDDGYFINAYWKSSKVSFNGPEMNKLVQKLFATLQPMLHTSCNFYYVSDMSGVPKNEDNLPDYSKMNYAKSFYNTYIFDAKSEFIDSSRNEMIQYEALNYSRFTYNSSEEPTVVAMKVKAKKISYYQLVIQNTRMNEGLKIDNMALKFIYQNYRK